jgi:acyl-CoA hydrolase
MIELHPSHLLSPIHLRDLPLLFRRRLVCPDVALLHVSPPDAHGFCTLGTSVDWARGAAEHAKDTVETAAGETAWGWEKPGKNMGKW